MAEFGKTDRSIAFNPGVDTRALKLDEIDLGGGKAMGDDFLSQLDGMAKEAEARKVANESSLQLDDLDLGDISIHEDFVVKSREDELLSKAKALIADDEYAEAQEPLLQLLEEVDEHHEALFLLALCRFHTMEPIDALRLLNRIRGKRMEAALSARVGILRERIRGILQTTALIENMLLLATGNFGKAAARVRELVEVDPEEWLYPFMLAGSLMKADEHEAAMDAILAGLETVDPEDRHRLEPLRQQIEMAWAREKMAEGRSLYRKGKFGAARSKLRRLDPACKATGLWQTFDGYLQRLDGGFLRSVRGYRGPADVKPPGSFHDAEALYQFLVEEEMRAVLAMVELEDFEGAIIELTTAVLHAPHYPYAQFLLAGAIYRRLGERISSGDAPPLQELLAGLESALGHARIGATDPEIRDGERLKDEIEKLLGNLKQNEREAEAVNGAIEEFHDIMQSVQEGISSTGQLKTIVARLQKLQERMPSVRREARSENAIEAVDHLEKALKKHLKDAGGAMEELGAAKGEAKLVNSLAKEFMSIMKKAKGGIRSRRQLEKIESRLTALKSEVRSLRKKVKSSQSKKALDDLMEAVNRNLDQIESARRGGSGGAGSVSGGSMVNTLAETFASRMQQLESSGGVSGYQERQELETFLNATKGLAENLRENASNEGERQLLDAIIQAADSAMQRYL